MWFWTYPLAIMKCQLLYFQISGVDDILGGGGGGGREGPWQVEPLAGNHTGVTKMGRDGTTAGRPPSY